MLPEGGQRWWQITKCVKTSQAAVDEAESYHCSTALRGQGTIITMTSEEDKYCTRTDCGILWEGGWGAVWRRRKGGGSSHQFSNLPRGKMHNHIISHTTWFKGGQNKFVRFPWVCQSVEGAAGKSLGCTKYETIMIIPLKHSEAIWQLSLEKNTLLSSDAMRSTRTTMMLLYIYLT